jgi:hypothetical protein
MDNADLSFMDCQLVSENGEWTPFLKWSIEKLLTLCREMVCQDILTKICWDRWVKHMLIGRQEGGLLL